MSFMRAVGKIQARHIHTGLDQAPDHARRIGGRAKCADNL
jgi:hypothetical protein